MSPAASARGLAQALAVDERPVGRAEVLDHDAPAVAEHARVAARELGVVAEPPVAALGAPDHELVVEREPLALGPALDARPAPRGPGQADARAFRAGSARGRAPTASVTASSVWPDADHVAERSDARLLDALAVDERPVRRAQSSIVSSSRRPRVEPGVAARELGIVAEPPGLLGGGPADEQLVVHCELCPGCHSLVTRSCSPAIGANPTAGSPA